MSEYDGGYEPTHDEPATEYPTDHYDGDIGDAIGQPLVDVAQWEAGHHEPGHEPDVEYKGDEHGEEYKGDEGAEYHEPGYGTEYPTGHEGEEYQPGYAADGAEYAGTPAHGSGGGDGTGPGTGPGDGSGTARLDG
jgi:hypothetical protein